MLASAASSSARCGSPTASSPATAPPGAVDSCRRSIVRSLAPSSTRRSRPTASRSPSVPRARSWRWPQMAQAATGRAAAADAQPPRSTPDELGAVVKRLVDAPARCAERAPARRASTPSGPTSSSPAPSSSKAWSTAFAIEEMTVSDYALREGVLLDTIQRTRGGSLHHLARRVPPQRRATWPSCSTRSPSTRRTWPASPSSCSTTPPRSTASTRSCREYLEAAALLANVGLFISHSQHHLHSYYVIRNSDRLTGLHRHRDRDHRPGRPLPPQERAEAEPSPSSPRCAPRTRTWCGCWPASCVSPSGSTAATRAGSPASTRPPRRTGRW